MEHVRSRKMKKKENRSAFSCGFCRRVRKKDKQVTKQTKKVETQIEIEEKINVGEGEEEVNVEGEIKVGIDEEAKIGEEEAKVEGETKVGIDDEAKIGESEEEREYDMNWKHLYLLAADNCQRTMQKEIKFLGAEVINERNWRLRVEVISSCMKILHISTPEQVHEYMVPLGKIFSKDPVAEVRSKGLELLAEIVAIVLFAPSVYTQTLLDDCRSIFLNSDSYRRRQSFGKMMVVLLQKKLMHTKQFMQLFEKDIIELSHDKVVSVRLITCQIALCAEIIELVKSKKVLERIYSLADCDSDVEIKLQARIILAIIDRDCKEIVHHKRTDKRIAAVKLKVRSEFKAEDWNRLGYSRRINLNPAVGLDSIERIDASTISYEEFVERFEKPLKPVILSGLTKDWPAMQKWTIPELLKKYRNQKFRCGIDDEGNSVKLKMKYFIDYMLSTHDDRPLSIFDYGFGDNNETNKLLDDYNVPHFFSDDLLRYTSENRRPPHRWIRIGPPLSSTQLSIEPLGTSSWDALIVGHKRWCLIHPTAPETLFNPTSQKHPCEAVNCFNTVYHRVLNSDWPNQFPVIHALQKPGDIVFVPSGWWNVSMNLDNIIAVTHNFCSLSNLEIVWSKIVERRHKLAIHWMRSLSANRPEIVPIIKEINRKANITIGDSIDSSSSSDSSNSDHEVQSNSAVNGNRQRMPTKRSERDEAPNIHCNEAERDKTSRS